MEAGIVLEHASARGPFGLLVGETALNVKVKKFNQARVNVCSIEVS